MRTWGLTFRVQVTIVWDNTGVWDLRFGVSGLSYPSPRARVSQATSSGWTEVCLRSGRPSASGFHMRFFL